MAADLFLAWGLSTSCLLRFSLKILLGGPKGSVLLGCSYSAEEIFLTQLLSAHFLMQPTLTALQAPFQYSQVVMLSVGCLAATSQHLVWGWRSPVALSSALYSG